MSIADSIYYSELVVTFDGSEIDTLTKLVRSPLLGKASSSYIIYEKPDEWSIGLGCYLSIEIRKDCVMSHDGNKSVSYKKKRLCDAISAAIDHLSVANWRLYGCTRYELSHVFYDLASDINDDDVLGYLFLPEYEIRIHNNQAVLRSIYPDKLNELLQAFSESYSGKQGNSQENTLGSTMDKSTLLSLQGYHQSAYQESVKQAVNEIQSNAYQKVILSRKVPLPEKINFLETYHNGRRKNSPARSFLIQQESFTLAGFSPETLLEVNKDGWISTQPLAGTRALGQSAEETARLQADLLSDSKELAEHAVSVKLAQEELATVCIDNTIAVSEFMGVRERGSVQHLASRVRGKLREDKHAWDAFEALFPAVTASGIPKKQAIDAIKRHEPCERSWYSGCVMALDSDGSMDAALTLRSVYQENDQCWLQAGAGVVDLSTPERELEETKEKLDCVMQSVI
ncbi:MAG: salicylate synthase [Cellvibrionaceae bacterium]|nr:salicylate synthase [Cellvibrionaceae bacterium]